ncbi:amidohydrolase [Pseudooceanicola sp. CBS1P-1]|uniref:Amidohydrolase n=1 Tax=Pseudooceanicola albus TaxID=2692189 RepID=A0A6L7GD41_9RHOB|nr:MULTISPECIES: M20 aminoacylase family protein [Pseudooceanicola]MBT9386587.1 amidohydrolase [Pseudooceanicola endophyticus]MXN20703.1 amidohydrolase [Pseudooceanicola albus]
MKSLLDGIRALDTEMRTIRHDLHAHPELGLETHRTSAVVADFLEGLGIETHRGVGGTGVVGVLRGRRSNRSVGLRADMDALAIAEATGLPYASRTPGLMHGCGHDGHTAMLLGAAKYLAQHRDFEGTVNLIFQPGEEGYDGAREMIRDGLFERFPCDAVFGMHNEPGLPLGQMRTGFGTIAAGGGNFDITVQGRGAHGAEPDRGIDPVLAACHVVTALQSIVARNVPPLASVVVSATRIEGGSAYNVIPESATISGTARYFDVALGETVQARIAALASGIAEGFGATAETDFRVMFAPHVNDPEKTALMVACARSILDPEAVSTEMEPSLGSEDFSFMLEAVTGAYMMIGNGSGHPLHHPEYDFCDDALVHGAALYVRLAQEATRAPEEQDPT